MRATRSRTVADSDVELHEGDIISIDGTTGIVVLGAVSLVEPEVSGDFDTILSWADEFRTMGVRANADTPDDAELGREFGAAGIGLCRTEHMFLGERKQIIQNFVLAENQRRARGRAFRSCSRSRWATTSASSRRWTGFPSRSVCSTRRCTSSSTTRASSRSRSSARSLPACGNDDHRAQAQAARADRLDGRGQPDARPARLPSGHHAPRDLRDAGSRDRACDRHSSRSVGSTRGRRS